MYPVGIFVTSRLIFFYFLSILSEVEGLHPERSRRTKSMIFYNSAPHAAGSFVVNKSQ
jgi:hypothetical protein